MLGTLVFCATTVLSSPLPPLPPLLIHMYMPLADGTIIHPYTMPGGLYNGYNLGNTAVHGTPCLRRTLRAWMTPLV